MLSTETIFLQPHKESDKNSAAQAHKNFALKDGDLPTLVNIYESWIKVFRLSGRFVLYFEL